MRTPSMLHAVVRRTVIDGEVTNHDRAESALRALSVYYSHTHYERLDDAHPTDVQDAIGDLMCDLMHLARRNCGATPNDDLPTPEGLHERVLGNFYEEEHDR